MAYTNEYIFEVIDFVIKKDKRGQPVSLQNRSMLLDTQGLSYFESLYDQYEKTNELTDSIKRFKVTKSGSNLIPYGTMLTLPSAVGEVYAHAGSLYYKKDGTDVKPVEIVSDDQFMMRQDSEIEYPDEDFPIARLITNYIEYLPTTLTQTYFTLTYLRYPTTPKYDYYIQTNGLPVYLAAGEKHTWLAGQEDSSGNVKTGAEGEYTSLTVELDFNDEDKLKIAARILQAMSIPINEAGVFQYAEQLKIEN